MWGGGSRILICCRTGLPDGDNDDDDDGDDDDNDYYGGSRCR